MAKKLTAKSVEQAKRDPTKRIEISDGGSGLYLVIQPSGTTLAKARELAAKALNKVAEGVDPAAENQATKQAKADAKRDKFEEIAREFIAKHAKPKTPRTWRQTAYRLGF